MTRPLLTPLSGTGCVRFMSKIEELDILSIDITDEMVERARDVLDAYATIRWPYGLLEELARDVLETAIGRKQTS